MKRRPAPSGARHRAVGLEGQELPGFWGGARVGAAVTEKARWCYRMEGVWPWGPLRRQHPRPPGSSTMWAVSLSPLSEPGKPSARRCLLEGDGHAAPVSRPWGPVRKRGGGKSTLETFGLIQKHKKPSSTCSRSTTLNYAKDKTCLGTQSGAVCSCTSLPFCLPVPIHPEETQGQGWPDCGIRKG